MTIVAPLIVGLLALASDDSQTASAASSATFEPIASVLMHPRCINCHQDQSPRQGDARTVHLPLVVRGKDDHGAPTQQCQTCHQTTNTADGFVPGVEDWRLAPLSMLWEGRSKEQICEQMKDPARDGGRRTGEQVIEHMKTDPLVLWAWARAGARPPPRSRTRTSSKCWKPGSKRGCHAGESRTSSNWNSEREVQSEPRYYCRLSVCRGRLRSSPALASPEFSFS